MRRFARGGLIASLALVAAGLFSLNPFYRSDSTPPVAVQALGLAPESPAECAQYAPTLRPFAVLGAPQDNDRATVKLTDFLRQANGGKWPWHGPQGTGDCVAFTWSKCIETCIAVMQVLQGEPVEWRPVFPPHVYGGGRVQIGRGQLRGAGLVPSWAGEFVRQFGALWSDLDSVPPYSGKLSDQWGRDGVPQRFLDLAADYPVSTIAPIRSAAEARDAICNGYPVAMASMQFGTNTIRARDGRNVAVDDTAWPHAQAVLGYDGNTPSGQRYFLVWNSWGENGHPRPIDDTPPGSYWITWEDMDRICKEGMTLAVSGATGFPAQPFVPDFSRIVAAAEPPAVDPVAIHQAAAWKIPAHWRNAGNLSAALSLAASVLLFVVRVATSQAVRHLIEGV